PPTAPANQNTRFLVLEDIPCSVGHSSLAASPCMIFMSGNRSDWVNNYFINKYRKCEGYEKYIAQDRDHCNLMHKKRLDEADSGNDLKMVHQNRNIRDLIWLREFGPKRNTYRCCYDAGWNPVLEEIDVGQVQLTNIVRLRGTIKVFRYGSNVQIETVTKRKGIWVAEHGAAITTFEQISPVMKMSRLGWGSGKLAPTSAAMGTSRTAAMVWLMKVEITCEDWDDSYDTHIADPILDRVFNAPQANSQDANECHPILLPPQEKEEPNEDNGEPRNRKCDAEPFQPVEWRVHVLDDDEVLR
ncbi:16793_t:CDS:2, partial [Acaulospora colombiana]